MTKNPFINALVASLYIIFVALIMFFGTKFAGPANSFIAPVAIISLFTLSAAVMGYLFCYQPAQLYFGNQKKQAVGLFLQTMGIFGGITALFLLLLFLKI